MIRRQTLCAWQQISAFIKSKYSFYLVLVVNIVLLSITKFYPSMDGPAHLHNSQLLLQLISGNQFLSDFYTLNSIAIPNWTSHIFLALATLVLPAWMAEKFLLIAYVAGMAFSYRYFLNQVNPKLSYLSILIFPFSYTFLFHLGFYNFSISFIFLFLGLAYFSKHLNSESIAKYLYLALIISLCYYSNVLTWAFLGLTLGILTIQHGVLNNKRDATNGEILVSVSKKILLLFVASLPSIVMLTFFISKTGFFTSSQSIPTSEITKWIFDARHLIIYTYGDEALTQVLFILLVILTAISLLNGRNKEHGQSFSNPVFITLTISLILLYSVPDGAGAGMMTHRFLIVFFFILLLWIGSRAIDTKLNSAILLISIILHVGLLYKHLNGAIKDLDKHAQTIVEGDNSIDKNSIVLPINLSEHWVEPHFSNYIGINKPVVILENYEAGVGWFPLKWNMEKIPNILLDDKFAAEEVRWISNTNSENKCYIDFLLIYGDNKKLKEEKWKKLSEVIRSSFTLKFKSEDEYISIYERKN